MYGGSVGLNYKGFNFDVDFGGVYGNEVFRVWGSLESPFPVSYTHLDVYKRQVLVNYGHCMLLMVS